MASQTEKHTREGPDCGCGTTSLKGLTKGQTSHINESPRTVQISSVPGTTVSYRAPFGLSRSKPTLLMLHSFTTDGTLYRPQLADEKLQEAVNLITVDLLGHGGTTTSTTEDCTCWDSAKMTLELMDKIGVQKAFLLGTDQGGWVAMQIALLAPEKVIHSIQSLGRLWHQIYGIIVLGTSIAAESAHTASLGCWDGMAMLSHLVEQCSSLSPTPDFQPSDDFVSFVLDLGFGLSLADREHTYWTERIRTTYAGDAGRRRLLRATQAWKDCEGLEGTVGIIDGPVLWLHRNDDKVYSVNNAQEGVRRLKGSRDAKLEIFDGGAHFLNATHPEEVDRCILGFVQKYS